MSESARKHLMAMGNASGTQPNLMKHVTRLQANFRGYIVRKRLEEIRNAVQNGTENGHFDEKLTE